MKDYRKEYLEIVEANKTSDSFVTNPSILSGNIQQDSHISADKNFCQGDKENFNNRVNSEAFLYNINHQEVSFGNFSNDQDPCNDNLHKGENKKDDSCINNNMFHPFDYTITKEVDLLAEKSLLERRALIQGNEVDDISKMYSSENGSTKVSHTNKQKSIVVDKQSASQSVVIESSNVENSQLINQSFNFEFRRKARRRTGKIVVKRKLSDEDIFEDNSKKIKLDKEENYLLLLSEELQIRKEKDIANKYKKEVEQLKLKLSEVEEAKSKKLELEKKELDRIKRDNLEISQKLQKELMELSRFKDNLFTEMRKFETEKKMIEKERETVLLEKIKLEKQAIQEQYNAESQKIEIEKSMIVEEKKKLEEFKDIELRKLEEQRLKIERERKMELQSIAEEKLRIEKMIEEQNRFLENERKLIKDEREKMNQTFLEISNKSRHETIRPRDYQLPAITLPKLTIDRKQTLANQTKNIHAIFQSIKKEHLLNQKPSDQQLNSKPVKRIIPGFDVDRIDPYTLYKKSIDIQFNKVDSKKYEPKTSIPFYNNEDEFEADDKKFTAALFTKDPKLNYLVKTQNEKEIRELFGNAKDIDVEKIFDSIENVTNFSPNKLRNRNSNRG